MAGDLMRAAREVLERNRRGSWTCPAAGIYPHQWLWDSCFVAIGLADHDPQRAANEIHAALRGQWTNGMVPHMIFAPEARDLGSARLWGSRHDSRAPRHLETSCITQPPLLAVAAWYVARRLSASDRSEFLRAVVPRIVRYHRWLYQERDPDRTGLVTLIHPWECGLDSTPPWMDALRAVYQPVWLRLVLRWQLTRFVRFVRRDTRYVPSAERESDDNGLLMFVLARRARRFDFDLRRLPQSKSLLVQDLGFNALLVVANRVLLELAADSGVRLDAELLESFDRTVHALEELWDDAQSLYCSRDAVTGELLRAPTIAAFFTLWANLQSDRMAQLIERLTSEGWSPKFPIPSVPTDSPQFDAERYWQGPTWINTNWLVIQGLRAQHESALADELQRRTLELVDGGGFAEYFSPYTGEGYGAKEFSWTAALALELLGPA